MTMASQPSLRLLTTPRAAALAGVLFGAVLVLIRTKMPEGVQGSTEPESTDECVAVSVS